MLLIWCFEVIWRAGCGLGKSCQVLELHSLYPSYCRANSLLSSFRDEDFRDPRGTVHPIPFELLNWRFHAHLKPSSCYPDHQRLLQWLSLFKS
ncbi:hypothetical protein EDB19DRAFT_628937 [Suillus lakei]|nr:hypothetical protein EDB19DRAFT_628937 [Suillus lakei]